jgi:hypothetical protein
MHCRFVCVRACVCVRARPHQQLSIEHETEECVICEEQHEAKERVDNRKRNKTLHNRMAVMGKKNPTLGLL